MAKIYRLYTYLVETRDYGLGEDKAVINDNTYNVIEHCICKSITSHDPATFLSTWILDLVQVVKAGTCPEPIKVLCGILSCVEVDLSHLSEEQIEAFIVFNEEKTVAYRRT